MVDKIKELCKKRKTSIFAIEKELEIGNGTIGKWGKNGRKPVYENLKKVADYFGVTVEYLLGETDEKKPAPTNGDGDDQDIAELVSLLKQFSPDLRKALLAQWKTLLELQVQSSGSQDSTGGKSQ